MLYPPPKARNFFLRLSNPSDDELSKSRGEFQDGNNLMRLSNMSREKHFLAVAIIFFAVVSAAQGQQGWASTRVVSTNQDLNTVYFLDSKRGWVGGDNGFLSRTDDGGSTWVRQEVGTSVAINDIYFRDKEDGFLLAGNASSLLATVEHVGVRVENSFHQSSMVRR